MERLLPALLLVAVVVLAALGMLLSWRARRRRGAALGTPTPAPADAGEVLAAAEVLYVATTLAGEPLQRVAVPGLGFRARGSATVHPLGVVLDLDGGSPVLLPADGLEVGRATWAIDRVVEPGGCCCWPGPSARPASRPPCGPPTPPPAERSRPSRAVSFPLRPPCPERNRNSPVTGQKVRHRDPA